LRSSPLRNDKQCFWTSRLKKKKKKEKKLDKNISVGAEVAERYMQVYSYGFPRGEKFATKENRDRGEEGAKE